LSLTTYGIPSGELCPAKFVFNMAGAGATKTARKQPGFMRFYEGNVSKFKRSKA